MRKLFAILLAALFSVFAGVEIIVPKNDNFNLSLDGEGIYYQPGKESDQSQPMLNYTYIYNVMYGGSNSNEPKCEINPTTMDRAEWPKDTQHLALFSPVYQKDGTEIEGVSFELNDNHAWSYTHEGSEDFYICAPSSGYIATSHFACNYGSEMQYIFNVDEYDEKTNTASVVTYQMTITGARCWYCCRNKPVPDDGKYVATTSDSLKDKPMGAGNLLCVGCKGTKVVITRAGRT